MKRKVIGKFNRKFTKINFYELVDEYKRFTVLRKKGTNRYYLWDNEYSLLSEQLQINELPTNRKDYKLIADGVLTWYTGIVFFWSTSKFVTEYGFPNYELLVDIYKQILMIREREEEILDVLADVKENESLWEYIKCLITTKRYINKQRKTIRRLEKEFKIIW